MFKNPRFFVKLFLAGYPSMWKVSCLRQSRFFQVRYSRSESGGPAMDSDYMDSDYDVFEVHPDGSVTWRGTIYGRDAADQRLQELADTVSNELRLLHLPTQTVIATMNARKSTPKSPESGARAT
jgi:hypothetical protein